MCEQPTTPNLVYTNSGKRAAAPTCCALNWPPLNHPGSSGWNSPATAGPSQAQRAEACWGNLAPWAGRLCSGHWGRGSALQVPAGRAPDRAWDCWRSFLNCWPCRCSSGRCSLQRRCCRRSWTPDGSYLQGGNGRV